MPPLKTYTFTNPEINSAAITIEAYSLHEAKARLRLIFSQSNEYYSWKQN